MGYRDPLMAIAEAASFGATNAKLAAQCEEIRQAIAANPNLERRYSASVVPARPPSRENSPSDMDSLLKDARRFYEEDDHQGVMSAVLLYMAEYANQWRQVGEPLPL
jgi:hypothetical protein